MILSPPFLPDRLPNEADEAFVQRAMSGGNPAEGAFPVSFQMNWHGGLHLTAPAGDAQVRAIADGKIAFLRSSTKPNNDLLHPLNYRGAWTDDGCVIISHQTEIGADAASGAPTAVGYFSIYMHLKDVGSDLKVGDPVYRKAVLGQAGTIYGVANTIHFEIVCDDDNVRLLTGRSDTYNPVDGDGRTDAIFGAMHFLILVGTPFLPKDPRGALTPPAPAFTNEEAMFVVMKFVQGDCTMQTLYLDGTAIGAPLVEPGYEYELFATASKYYPQSPSAGYELLRLGRVRGPDPLNPADAPHWRRVAYPGGVGWVDLNGANVRKFSDADFPFWDHWWMLIDGSASADSRCRDVKIIELLDPNGDLNVTPQEAQQKLQDPGIQVRLAHKICKFATEWDAATIDSRWGWLQTDPQTKMNAAEFARFKAHVSALSFWQQAKLGIDGVHWHFHPRQFVIQFRQCGWLSLDELTQLMPRNAWDSASNKTSPISWATARGRFSPYLLQLNRMFRKYNLLDAERQIHFLAQSFIETALWQTMREFGTGHQQHHKDGTLYWPAPAMEFYTVFYGRGAMQLTWPMNYEGYGIFRQYGQVTATYTYSDSRITHASKHQWSDGGPVKVWFRRFDPEIVADDPFAAFDSAGFYWVSKHHSGHLNINRVADQPFSTHSVGRVSVLVNGGGYGFGERQSYAAFLKRYRDDDTATTAKSTFSVQYTFSATNTKTYSIRVDFTPQRPSPPIVGDFVAPDHPVV